MKRSARESYLSVDIATLTDDISYDLGEGVEGLLCLASEEILWAADVVDGADVGRRRQGHGPLRQPHLDLTRDCWRIQHRQVLAALHDGLLNLLWVHGIALGLEDEDARPGKDVSEALDVFG